LRVRVEGANPGDPYVRSYGATVDRPLPIDWRGWKWEADRYKTGFFKSVSDEFDVPDTAGYVEVGISASSGYPWHVRVYANGVLMGEGDVWIGNWLHVPLAPPPPPPTPPLWQFITALVPMLFSLGVIAYSEASRVAASS